MRNQSIYIDLEILQKDQTINREVTYEWIIHKRRSEEDAESLSKGHLVLMFCYVAQLSTGYLIIGLGQTYLCSFAAAKCIFVQSAKIKKRFLNYFSNGKFGTEVQLLVNSFISESRGQARGRWSQRHVRFVYANIQQFFMRPAGGAVVRAFDILRTAQQSLERGG